MQKTEKIKRSKYPVCTVGIIGFWINENIDHTSFIFGKMVLDKVNPLQFQIRSYSWIYSCQIIKGGGQATTAA